MAPRNESRRIDILTSAYQLFGQKQYDKVSLTDISRSVGISKSLLQHYFSQKIEIEKTMINELLEVSFSYMTELPPRDEDLFQIISDYNMFFFKGVAGNYNLRQFLLSSVRQEECLDVWVDTICNWLRRYCGEETFTYRQLKTAMCFSMAGTMHLFQHQDELDISYQRFCHIHIRTILSFLDYSQEKIDEIVKKTDSRIESFDMADFMDYCEKNIPWMSL